MPKQPRAELSRELGLFTITMVGVGAMIGAGIFVLTGIAAGTAGPALIISFTANGVITLLTALVYAELGSAIPEAGGGYLWVKEGLPGANAFLAGWMSWFAHAVAGSLYALGFGAYFSLVLEEFGWSLLGLHGELLEKGLAVGVAVLFVAINFKGVSETGLAGNIVTSAKVLVLGVFIASGLAYMAGHPVSLANFTPLAPRGVSGVLTAMGLTFIAFEGYEIIVQAGEEVKNPKRNIPRAVFWSLAIVIPVYVLVAVTAVGAVQTGSEVPTWQWLGEHKELGLAEAARQFMPLGTTLLLIGGLLSTMSALNATTFSSTRVSFAMGRDRNLPDFFSSVHQRTRTPYLALLYSGVLIIFMAVAVPIEDVAAAADVMFLLLFLQVNVAVITIRRKYGEALDYGFLIPFFPYIPILGIITKLGLALFMFNYSRLAWYTVLGWIIAGGAIYYSYARKREREKRAPPRVLEEAAESEGRYRILVPVADPAGARTLIDLAAMVAKHRDGVIVLLHVIAVPRQTPLQVGRAYIREVRDGVMDRASDLAEAHGVPHSSVIRIAHWPAEAIIHEVEERDIDMVVMGWRGRSRDPRTAIGRNIDRVLRHADCHVVVVRGDDLSSVGSILVPIAYPRQARVMLELAQVFEEETSARVELFHLMPPGLDEEQRRRRLDEIYEGLADLNVTPEKEPGRSIRIEETERVASRIVDRSGQFDLTILGASREGWFRKLTAGTMPERIARRIGENKLLLVKHSRSPVRSWVLDIIDFFRDITPITEREDVVKR